MKYTLGLDIGITSIGWCLMLLNEQNEMIRIEDCGVRLFESLEKEKGKLANQDRRLKRGQRRLIRRKQLRLQELKNFLKKELNVNFLDIDIKALEKKYKGENEVSVLPYTLKIKGLSEKLTVEELSIVLYHYSKYRGFKSNRKVDDQAKTGDEGKLLSSISKVEKTMKEENLTATQYLFKYVIKEENYFRIHNGDANYSMTFKRSMYQEECSKILDKQIELKVITKDFKDAYLADRGFLLRQRDFSEGPGKGSKYGAADGESFIEKMISLCKFDKKLRAPKNSFSAESFVLLSFLNNLTYKDEQDNNYRHLEKEQINKIYEKALKSKELKYLDIVKVLGLKNAKFKGLDLTKKSYGDLIKSFKEKNKINFQSKLNDEQMIDFKKEIETKKMETKILSLKSFVTQKKILGENVSKSDFDSISTDDYDTFAKALLMYKTDDKISGYLKSLKYNDNIIQAVLKMDTISETINLSLELCQKINKHLLEGKMYNEAMKLEGYEHSEDFNVSKTYKFLPSINKILNDMEENLTNVIVKHILFELRKLINAIIEEYGVIDHYNIELAREVAKNFKERGKIRNQQLNNFENNLNLKRKLILKYPSVFRDFHMVKRDDVIAYKLLHEQKFICPYCQCAIDEEQLFSGTLYQVDHIIPYSRSYDDSYNNKVLVCSKCNQNKKEKTPREYLSKEDFKKLEIYLNNNDHILDYKKEIFTINQITDDFTSRNLNDTRYATRLIGKIIKAYLKPNQMVFCNGNFTSFIKAKWGINSLTHSLYNKDMKKDNLYYIGKNQLFLEKDILKLDLISINGNSLSLEFPDKKIKENAKNLGLEKSNDSIIKYNNTIKYFIEHLDILNNTVFVCKDNNKNLEEIFSSLLDEKENPYDVNQSIRNDYILLFLGFVKLELDKNMTDKDRTNHLHHIADAAVIACASPTLNQRVATYFKLKKNEPVEQDELNALGSKFRDKFPIPYDNFKNDLKNRVYQRDFKVLMNTLKSMDNYENLSNKNLKNICVVMPSRSSILKQDGALHQETFYGKSKNEGTEVITKRVDVHQLDFKSIEKLFDINYGNKEIYAKLVEWLKTDKSTYPFIMKGKQKHEIKKVKLIESRNIHKRIHIKENKFVESEDVFKIDFYKTHNDENTLYCCPLNMYKIKNSHREDIFYELFSAQGNNTKYISKKELQEEYKLVYSFHKNDLVEIEKKDGEKGLGYICGASSGIMEVKSVLGDGKDLTSTLFSTLKTQYKITISTIKGIKLREISVLGKLN